MKVNYDFPTMVVFCHQEDGEDEIRMIGGIAYNDYIICGECGGLVMVDEVLEQFGEDGIRELDWIDISEAIFGD